MGRRMGGEGHLPFIGCVSSVGGCSLHATDRKQKELLLLLSSPGFGQKGGGGGLALTRVRWAEGLVTILASAHWNGRMHLDFEEKKTLDPRKMKWRKGREG